MAQSTLDQPALAQLYLRPRDPGCAAITPRLQQRTSRSFETESPPDRLAIWLLDRGYTPVATPSGATGEYGRLGRGLSLIHI